MSMHGRTLVASLEDAIADLRASPWLAVPIRQNIGVVRSFLASVLGG